MNYLKVIFILRSIIVIVLKPILTGNPDLVDDQLNRKNELLDNRLREVYVTSEDKPTTHKAAEKALPTERKNVGSPEFGYLEPVRITKGKLSIRQALILIGRHHQDPVIHSAMSLANEYTIHPRVSGMNSNSLIYYNQNKFLLLQRIF